MKRWMGKPSCPARCAGAGACAGGGGGGGDAQETQSVSSTSGRTGYPAHTSNLIEYVCCMTSCEMCRPHTLMGHWYVF